MKITDLPPRYQEQVKEKLGKQVKPSKPKEMPKGLQHIHNVLTRLNVPYTTELQFAKPRKFRADIALVHTKTLIEFEGIVAAKSRHTTLTGYSKDCTKYNIAACMGYKVLRYTALNVNDFEADLKNVLGIV